MATNLQLYEAEVFQFLQSATIIFSPLATQMNLNLQAAGLAVDETDPTTWKYYLNLSGQYHSSDTPMTILSLDTKQTVNFTPAMLAASPKTKASYVIGSSYYNALCQAYPAQVDLIKSILYPVDMESAIAAPDFTLIGWGDGYLEADEQDAIIYEINQFVAYATTRWYFAFLSYEVYYTWAFWGVLWQSLPSAVFAARLKYLHTSYVHSFHIWSYLESNGIGDYSDILTRQQAMFLYRNIDYLNENKGKQSNLILLVNNLLSTINVGLVGKSVYMNTATNAAICAWTPEFVSTIIPTNNSQSLTIIPPETMAAINAELIAAGFEVNSSPTYIAEQQTLIGDTTLNILPTKLVEIQKLGVDQKYGAVLNNFILDTMVSMLVTDRYAPTVDITDPTTNISISLSGKDALALYYYAVHRASREDPILLPTIYAPTCAFRYDVTAASFPETFKFNGYTYPTRSYLSIAAMLDGLVYPTGTINDPTVFATLVADLFLVLIRHIRYSRTQAGQVALAMFVNYFENHVLQTTPYTFALSTIPDYATWKTTLEIDGLIAQLDAQVDYVDAYNALATAITTQLIPEDNAIFTFFAYTSQGTDNLYDRLKSLFVQLCSYNIAFLDTSRVNTWWFFYDPVVYAMAGITETQSLAFDPLTEPAMPVGIDVTPLVGIAEDSTIDIHTTDVVLQKVTYSTPVQVTPIDGVQHILGTPTVKVEMLPPTSDAVTIKFRPLSRIAFFTETTSGVT